MTIAIGTPLSLVLISIILPLLWILQRHYLATSSRIRIMQMASQAPVLGALGSGLDGRLTLRAYGLNDRMMADMSTRIYNGTRPGYLFLSLQTWLTLMLELGNVVIITAVTVLLVVLRQANIGWGAIALLNSIAMAGNIKNLMFSWTHWEISMGAMTRIISYNNNTPAETITNATGPPGTWPTRGEIDLRGLTLAYE